MPFPKRPAAPAVLCALAATTVLLASAGCTSNEPQPSADRGDGGRAKGGITVSASDDTCAVSATSAKSGTLVFEVTNDGSKVTEFYLYRADGTAIAGEVENIGPGLTRRLVVRAQPGTYTTACKPGMSGEGIRARFTVTGSGTANAGADQRLLDQAAGRYRAYVTGEVGKLLGGTKQFVTAYKAGEYDRARELYAPVRAHWERIEPVAESFGDLDPKMDLREADLAEGQTWTGWHLLEKDLWWPAGAPASKRLTDPERAKYADQLLADTRDLHARVATLKYQPDQMANGAKELLDEVATGKVTGEEEIWSHTDLYDFQANVEGARVAFDSLRPVVNTKDPALGRVIEQRFTALQKDLDRYRRGDGFVSYTDLSKAQVKRLSDSVNALAEPLSRLTAAVLV
ncbi:iron uptake system component EfeO [Actinopolymorpha cephalotaxi]|uniref:Iron uptake system component EfeO n=1 Tax=Actinopolymorpha cephalotaxi TaxID=504797 RepID=A0A1I2PFS1_9ACTN|nr:iron uptake system protein EfeO [Actinopolymorpha cephalotaxi]NYH83657.1 iron uptake system component EfeO [Actinopolymorpha cephalotaxi]SFG13989.1 iron uptake system component EfeO [Actinopolymorpha cephalotaxi]